MKKIGLIGGISWVSTIDYYRMINEGINKKLGGLNFAECLIYSLNFGDIYKVSWENAFELLLNASKKLEGAGVDAIVLCANTAHLHADLLQKYLKIPIIHIAEETAKTVLQVDIKKVGLLGTKFTMEMDFYHKKLAEKKLITLIPEDLATRNFMQIAIRDELGIGLIKEKTKEQFISIGNSLIEKGAQALILGCTEIPLLISQKDFKVPVFDTTEIHSAAAVEFALS